MTLKGKGVKRSREWQCSWFDYLAGFFKYSKSAGKVQEKYGFGYGYGYARKNRILVRVRKKYGCVRKIGCGIWYGYGLHLAKEVRRRVRVENEQKLRYGDGDG